MRPISQAKVNRDQEDWSMFGSLPQVHMGKVQLG